MVVLLLISILMGIGVGAFNKVGGGPELAKSRIKDVVGTTRLHAIRERASAVVLVEPEQNLVTGIGWRNVGCWHFEEKSENESSGFPVGAGISGALVTRGGVIGNCLSMAGGRAPVATIPAQPSLSPVSGVSVELFVFLKTPGERNLVKKGEFFYLKIDDEGRPYCGIKVKRGFDKQAGGGEVFQLGSDETTLPLGKWAKVSMHFNGYMLTLSVDGIILAREYFTGGARLLTDQVTSIDIGGEMTETEGDTESRWLVDELRIGAAVPGDIIPLPDVVSLAGKRRTIHFDRDGRLDRNCHTAPVTISFVHGESRRIEMTIGLFGEIR